LAERSPGFSPSKDHRELVECRDVTTLALFSLSVGMDFRVSTPNVWRRIG
jgi:hypothetical protein